MAVDVRPVAGQQFVLAAADEQVGLGRHPLFQRGAYMQGVTVLVTGSSVEAVLEPLDERVRDADFAFTDGREYVVDYEVAQLIFDAGFGRWLTLVGG